MTTAPTLTATDFKAPLLRTLGAITGFKANVPVLGKDTYPGVMVLMGITNINEHGLNGASKQPMVAKWIQWANRNATTAGHTAAPPNTRGKWMLTDEGVQEARRLAVAAGDPVATPKVVADPAPAVKVSITLPAAPMVQDTSGYHQDAYLRSLAIDRTACFGKYSPHGAAVCADCPLAADCRNRQLAEFSRLAAALAHEDSPTKAKPVPAAGTTAAPTPAGAASTRFKSIDFKGADVILNKAPAFCADCGEVIEKDERCRWVEELPGTDDGGLFHLDCSGGE